MKWIGLIGVEIMKSKIIFGIFVVVAICLIIASPVNSGQTYERDFGIEESVDGFIIAADGDEWLIGWKYRQKHKIEGQAGVSTNYQMKFHVEMNAASSSGEIVDCNSHCQTDFGDIRFTGASGGLGEELDYWMEEKTDSDDATFWVEVKDSLGTDRNVYVYYGTPGTTSTTSNGGNTFDLFDDFNRANSDTVGGGWTDDAGNGDNDIDTNRLKIVQHESEYAHIEKAAPAMSTMSVQAKVYYNDDAGGSWSSALGVYWGNFDYLKITPRTDPLNRWYGQQYYTADDSDTGYLEASVAYGTWYWVRIRVGATNIYFDKSTDGASWTNAYNVARNGDLSGNPSLIIVGKGYESGSYTNLNWDNSYSTAGAEGTTYHDDVFVRKYFVSEPQHSTWESEETNAAPVNSQTPVCTNMVDTDNLYAGYKTFLFTSNITDANGYEDIDYIRLSSYDEDSSQLRWTVQYSQESNGFSEASNPAGYIDLLTGSCEYSKSGNAIDITWHIKIEWTSSPYILEDDDLVQRVKDYSNDLVTNEYNSNYDYVSKLDFLPMLSDGSGNLTRGNINDDITATGTVIYYGSVNNFPPSDQVDAWVSCADVAGSPWSDTTLTSGAFSMTVDSDDVVGEDTYTFKIVKEGEGLGGTDFAHETHTHNYVADRIKVMSYTIVNPSGDNRNNIGTTYTIDIELHYDYDGTDVADGTITVNGESMDSYQGSGKWRWTPTQAGVTGITYNNMQATGNTHGITVEDNTVTQLIIWDRIYAISLSYGGDTRINTGTSVNFDYELHYDYDETDVTDGTIIINSQSFAHQGSGLWRYTTSNGGAVGDITFDSIVASGNTHGITSTTTDGNDVTLIWDRVQVQSYHIYWLTARENIGTAIGLEVLLWYDYDDTLVTDGSVTINGVSASHDVIGWWQIGPEYATVTGINYNNVQASGNEHGITTEDQNGQSQLLIWDRIQVQDLTADDDDERINVGTAIYLHVTLWYDYDDTIVTDGTVTYFGISAEYSGADGIWDFDYTSETVRQLNFNSVYCSGNEHGITEKDDNGYSIDIIWDRIRVVSYTITDPSGDNRNNIGTNYTMYVELHYNFDEQDVTDGTVTINGITGTYLAGGQWYFYDLENTVMATTYNNVQCSGNTHGITVEDNTVTQQVIWDRIKVVSYTIVSPSDDNRNNIGTTYTIDIELHYDYDETDVADGTITVNGESMDSYQGSGKWRWTPYQAGVTGITYNNMAATGNTYGITVEDNTVTQLIIWDRIQVQSYSVSDARDNINDNVNIDATLWYDYDDTLVTDGTVTINGFNAAHQGSGVWRITRTSASVTAVTYNNVQATGNTHGITTEDQNGQSQQVIWDRIYVVSLSYGGDTRVNIGTSINFDWELHYDYDEADVTDGTITINGYNCAYQGSGVWRYTNNSGSVGDLTLDNIQASGNTHGITTEFQNSKTVTMIWDRIKILTTIITDNYIEFGVESTTVNVTAELDFDSHALGSGDTLYMNDTEMTWDTDHFYIIFGPYSVMGSWELFVNSSSANEATYGIAVIWLNGQSDTVATDRVIVISYAISDARDNINDYIWINVTVQYESDSSTVTDGTIVINGYSFSHLGSGIWRHNRTESSAGDIDFDTLVASGNIRGITVVNQNGQSQLAIWDSLTITITGPTDNRQNLNANASGIIVSAIWDYDSETFDGTFTLNNTDYNGDGTAVRWGYTVSSVSGDSYGITVISSNDDTYMIWDSYTISFTVDDNRININDNATVGYTVISDYDSIAYDGTVNLNYTTWEQATAQRQGFTVSSLSGDDTYGITAISNNDEDYIIWDSYTIAMTIDDHRVNINVNITFGYTVISDYDSIHYDGTRNLNYTTYTHATVQRQGYTMSSLSGDDTYGITAIKTNDEDYAIWDRIYAVSLDYGGDTRVDTSTSIDFDYELHYDYDEADVTDGTIVINGYSFVHQGSGVWRYTNDSAVVGDITFDSIVASGNTHGITITTTDSNDVTLIWDRIKILTTVTDDSRIDYDTQAIITVTAELEYDHHALGTGDTLYMNGTSMSWNGSHFVLNPQFADVDQYSFFVNSTSANEDTYGITVINLDGNSVNQIWDRIDVIMKVNMTWTVVNYYINVSYTGTYEYDGVAWTGYATIANTSIETGDSVHYEELTFVIVGNNTFYATAVEDSGGFGISVLGSTTTEWCVWDDARYSSLTGDWFQQDIEHVYYTILTGTWSWTFNDTDTLEEGADDGCVLQSYMNNTGSMLKDDWAIVDTEGTIGDLIVGAFGPNAVYANISINCETTINGVSYDWEVYNIVLIVDISHSVEIQASSVGQDSIGVYFSLTTNWGNATFTMWDNITDTPVFVDFWAYEGMFQITKSLTVGTHRLILLINGTHGGSDQTGQIAGTENDPNGKWIYDRHNYTVTATYGDSWVYIYNSRGTGFDDNKFIVYINGSRYRDNHFYNRTDYIYNITVTDYFGYKVYQKNDTDYSRHINVGIEFYTYKVKSELQGQEVYFNLTRTGGAKFSQHLLPDEILPYYLVAGEYTYEFRKVTSPGGSTYVYYEGTFTLSCDKTHIIDGTNLRDIVNDIELIPTGKANVKPLEQSVENLISAISLMQMGMWGLAAAIIVGMAATATEETEITKDGKVIKKRKIPKQLKRFAFGKGAKNPKSKSIPKGAGQASWGGVTFRDDVRDWRDDM